MSTKESVKSSTKTVSQKKRFTTPFHKTVSQNRFTRPFNTTEYARSEYHTQLAKMSFYKIFDLTAGVYFYSYNILQYRFMKLT